MTTRVRSRRAGRYAASIVLAAAPISAACNDTIGAVADVIVTAIDEGRLGVPLPAE